MYLNMTFLNWVCVLWELVRRHTLVIRGPSLFNSCLLVYIEFMIFIRSRLMLPLSALLLYCVHLRRTISEFNES